MPYAKWGMAEVIRRVGGKWYLYTADGKRRLGGPYARRAQAVRRERQVQFFKHRGEAESGEAEQMKRQKADPGWVELAEDVRQWVEENKAGGVWITQAQMTELCSSCAEEMKRRGLKKVNIFSEAMKPHLLQGLCDKFGGSAGFFTRCEASSVPVTDKKRFCAWLHHECHGIWPGEEVAVDLPRPGTARLRERLAESGWWPTGDENPPLVPYGAKTFGDLEAMQAAQDASEQMHILAYEFGQLVYNILGDAMVKPADKMLQLRIMAAEFISLAEQVMGAVGTDEEPTPPTVEYAAGEAAAVRIGETRLGAVLAISPVDLAEAADGAAVPMKMDVVLIEPGFGNSRDRNYYPAEVLARDAGVFVGCKMYETDHRAAEKSTRTWVSTVKAIKGATETGAPIAETVVHDPGFAERVRALDASLDAEGKSMLGRMECSILGAGLARKGKVNGQEANIVERISEGQSVDWVTRAGAGGRALKLSESEGPMGHIVTISVQGAAADAAALTSRLGARAAELFGEGAKVEKVELAEAGKPGEAKPEAKPEATPAPKAETLMEAAAVQSAVEASNLPAPSKARLAAGKYADAPALEAAIAAEVAYVKALTGSGQPFGQGASAPADQPGTHRMTAEEYDKQADAIFERYHLPTQAPK